MAWPEIILSFRSNFVLTLPQLYSLLFFHLIVLWHSSSLLQWQFSSHFFWSIELNQLLCFSLAEFSSSTWALRCEKAEAASAWVFLDGRLQNTFHNFLTRSPQQRFFINAALPLLAIQTDPSIHLFERQLCRLELVSSRRPPFAAVSKAPRTYDLLRIK